MKRALAVIGTSALLVSACGSGSDDAEGVDVPEPVVDDTLLDADELTESAEALGVSALSLAFEQTAGANAYRAELAMGMTMDMGALGQTISFPADPANAMIFIESDAEGQQHTLVDMAPMMSAILESSGAGGGVDATTLLGGDLSMETWLDGSIMTMDMGGFGAILAQTPGAAGLPADVFTVDVSRLGDGLGGPEITSTLAGQAAPDPVEMAQVLNETLVASGAIEGTDDAFSGTIGFLDYSRAFGQDPSAMLGGMDATFEQLGGTDVAQAMLDVFESMDVDVAITLAEGAIDTLRFDIDMSVLFAELPAILAESGMSDADLAGSDMLADSTFEMTMLMDYDLDPSIDVVVPAGDFPDFTDDFLTIFDDAVAGN
ncbi:hypothetical protein [Ilumatobacter coccineus]|uniref:Lipoprotein n=1 Tax=Ilumatobacter coccineus (strain NBRC 103263 / KCTC 29153 / YM16-304) TaxID=1313172 RepID=A0A6C7ECN6_ILUCY|nr:hypothetical protein [Ilumatobacter coccineus]BAN04140.1 hypothetical protein YM304_38260 [Ilumatobacter coccineus YM16-304]